MLPKYHFLASLILTAILYPHVGVISLLVFATGWLIDLDHALYYVLRFRNFEYKKMYAYFKDRKFGKRKILNMFHTLEFYLITLILAFVNKYFLVLALGLFLHVTMDTIHLAIIKRYSVRYWTMTGWVMDRIKGI